MSGFVDVLKYSNPALAVDEDETEPAPTSVAQARGKRHTPTADMPPSQPNPKPPISRHQARSRHSPRFPPRTRRLTTLT
eukprot:scaffold10766_cov51-Isochrysis_galbana.AAC.1